MRFVICSSVYFWFVVMGGGGGGWGVKILTVWCSIFACFEIDKVESFTRQASKISPNPKTIHPSVRHATGTELGWAPVSLACDVTCMRAKLIKQTTDRDWYASTHRYTRQLNIWTTAMAESPRNVVIAMDESDFANFGFECKYLYWYVVGLAQWKNWCITNQVKAEPVLCCTSFLDQLWPWELCYSNSKLYSQFSKAFVEENDDRMFVLDLQFLTRAASVYFRLGHTSSHFVSLQTETYVSKPHRG